MHRDRDEVHLHNDVGQRPLELAQAIILVGPIYVYTQAVLARDDGDGLQICQDRVDHSARENFTSCLILSFRAPTMAHLMSSSVSSSYSKYK